MSGRFALRQAAQRSPLLQFAVSHSPHILAQCVAVSIKLLLTTFNEVDGKIFL
jgi:hypothetical protein